jgi:integrase
MRHSFVTRAREAGLSDFVVSTLSGHKTSRMVEHYSHQTATALESARGSLEAAFKPEDKSGNNNQIKETSHENQS